MAETNDQFTQWEEDFRSESGGVIVPSDTIDFAQNLQLGMLDAKPDQRFHMGMMALELLEGHPNPLQYNNYVLRTEKAYLTIHVNSSTREGHALRYGGMYLAGRVGHYALDRIEDEWMLALQVFEPKQLAVDSDRDRIYKRLPAPLMLPVASIRPPFLPYSS